jgi:hypothetical protein
MVNGDGEYTQVLADIKALLEKIAHAIGGD